LHADAQRYTVICEEPDNLGATHFRLERRGDRAMRVPDRVNLRPLTETDVDVLDGMENDPSAVGEHMWTGFRDPKKRRRRWEEDGCIGASSSMLAIASPDGALLGAVVWWPHDVVGPAGGCFELGCMVLPNCRGQGVGAAAQRALADYLFTNTLANRIQALTGVDNKAERRSLERAGFQLEGILRGAGFLGGRWGDGALYARLRDDPDTSD
jgi:RimJ/RimL family protein N-acetyltransferase